MEGVLPLAALLAASGGVLYYGRKARKQQTEGFDLVNPTVRTAFGPDHTRYIEQSATRFNELMNTMNPLKNALVPPTATKADINRTEQTVKDALRGLSIRPKNPTVNVEKGDDSQYLINRIPNSTALMGVKTCEAVKTDDCSKFLDPTFQQNCGICHVDGTDSNGRAWIGGLFIDPSDKQTSKLAADVQGLRKPQYTPTVGTCDPKRFSTSYEQCIRVKKQLQCQATKSFNDPAGCSQCFGDQSFQFIDTEIEKLFPQLILSGKGTWGLYNGTTLIKSGTFTEGQAVTVDVPDFKEGTILGLNVSGEGAFVGGYLQGTTPTGNFIVDLIRLVDKDAQTMAKPALAGFFSINEANYSKIRPGRGKPMISLFIVNPFTFLQPDEEEAQKCATAFIATQDGAEFLNRHPCYKKGQGPGLYSQECLQQMFVDAGCSSDGTAYPSTPMKANELMKDTETGQAYTLAQIGNSIYSLSQQAATGRDGAGNEIPLEKWDEQSMKCLGVRRSGPCDRDNKDTGPLGKECLAYLYNNQGADVFIPGGVGPTYTSLQEKSSLFPNGKDRFCTPQGTLSPFNPDGSENTAAINLLRSKGGAKQVQAFLDSVHRKANDNVLADQDRKEFVKQCYGVDFARTSSETLGMQLNGNCVPTTLVPAVTNPVPGQIKKNIQVKSNWTYTFTLNPSKKLGVWSNIFFASRTGQDNNDFGARCPAVFFDPNSTRLYVSFITQSGRDSNVRMKSELPLNQDTNVELNYAQGILTVKCTGGLNETLTQEMESAGLWNATLSVGQSKFDSFLGTLTNLSYCTYDNPFPSVLDERAGRSKRPQIVQNYTAQGWDWSQFSRPVVTIAAYGEGPWGTYWGRGIPLNTGAQWIWVRPIAGSEPDQRTYPFLKRYTNTTGQGQTCTLHAVADDYGYLAINQQVIDPNFLEYKAWQITLPPGESMIHFNVRNGAGPAGLCVACIDMSGKILFVSDGSWTTKTNLAQ
jgi:hypothetical protein